MIQHLWSPYHGHGGHGGHKFYINTYFTYTLMHIYLPCTVRHASVSPAPCVCQLYKVSILLLLSFVMLCMCICTYLSLLGALLHPVVPSCAPLCPPASSKYMMHIHFIYICKIFTNASSVMTMVCMVITNAILVYILHTLYSPTVRRYPLHYAAPSCTLLRSPVPIMSKYMSVYI